jgi:chromosome segregation ATPase
VKKTLPILLFALTACGSTPSNTNPDPGATSSSVSPTTNPGAGTLYARDGSVVTAGSQSSRPDQEPRRELGSQEGSRVYLLELYQKAMDEKNALALEVESLRATLEDERNSATATTGEQDKLKAELAEVTKERDALRAQALDLAARVTSAQIARLEAEKSLLQTQIDAAQQAEAASSRRSGSTSRDTRSTGGKH